MDHVKVAGTGIKVTPDISAAGGEITARSQAVANQEFIWGKYGGDGNDTTTTGDAATQWSLNNDGTLSGWDEITPSYQHRYRSRTGPFYTSGDVVWCHNSYGFCAYANDPTQ